MKKTQLLLIAFLVNLALEGISQAQPEYSIKLDLENCRDHKFKKTIPGKQPEEIKPEQILKGKQTITSIFSEAKMNEIELILKDQGESQSYSFTKFKNHGDADSLVLVINPDNKIDNISEELAFPYHLTFYIKGDKKGCPVKIGSDKTDNKKAKPENQPQLFTQYIKKALPNGVENNTGLENINIAKNNMMLYLDCSGGLSAQSNLYKRNKWHYYKQRSADKITDAEKKKEAQTKASLAPRLKPVKSLRTDHFLQVYLNNFNKYKYKVEVNEQQIDFEQELELSIKDKVEDKVRSAPSTVSTGIQKIPKKKRLNKIKKYATANKELDDFIEATKASDTPNQALLKLNQGIINSNFKKDSLTSTNEVIQLYNSLDDVSKKNIENEYKTALQFDEKKVAMQSLSYIALSENRLPLKINSFDQAILSITIKDENNQVVGSPRDYTFRIFGGIKIDQSFGVIAHGLWSDEFALKSIIQNDTTFALNEIGLPVSIIDTTGMARDSIVQIEPVLKQQIIEDPSNNQFALGLSTLTHFYYRTGLINFGLQLGIAFDFMPEENLRFLSGGSIMFNDGRHRVSLNAGLAIGKIKQLSVTTQVGDLIEGSASQVPLVEKYHNTLYVGLSYNIPLNRNSTQEVEEK